MSRLTGKIEEISKESTFVYSILQTNYQQSDVQGLIKLTICMKKNEI